MGQLPLLCSLVTGLVIVPSDHGCVIPGKASGWEDSRGKARLHLMTENHGGRLAMRPRLTDLSAEALSPLELGCALLAHTLHPGSLYQAHFQT